VLLDRSSSWQPWLRYAVLACGVLAVAGVITGSARRALGRRLAAPVVALALAASLAGPVAYAAQTISTGHTGSTPTAGPSTSSGFGSGGGFGSGRGGGGGGATSSALVTALESGASTYRWVAATSGSQSAAQLELSTGGEPVMAIGGFSGQGGNLTLAQFKAYVAKGEIHYYIASSGAMGGGGMPSGARSSSHVGGPPSVGSSTRTGGSRPSGGFTVHGGPGGTSSSSNSITSWVEAHFKKVTLGGQTVYDLSQRTS
jgi:hypothetical protein